MNSDNFISFSFNNKVGPNKYQIYFRLIDAIWNCINIGNHLLRKLIYFAYFL